MAAKLTRLTHKIAIQLHIVAGAVPFAVLAPGGQSGNFWIHTRIWPTQLKKESLRTPKTINQLISQSIKAKDPTNLQHNTNPKRIN
jgi:uncharacterized membrane protein